jgi:hypothetical protein
VTGNAICGRARHRSVADEDCARRPGETDGAGWRRSDVGRLRPRDPSVRHSDHRRDRPDDRHRRTRSAVGSGT